MRKALLILICLALWTPSIVEARTLTPAQGAQVVQHYWRGWHVLKQHCHNKTPQTVRCVTWFRDHVITEGHSVQSHIVIYSTVTLQGHRVIYREASGEATI